MNAVLTEHDLGVKACLQIISADSAHVLYDHMGNLTGFNICDKLLPRRAFKIAATPTVETEYEKTQRRLAKEQNIIDRLEADAEEHPFEEDTGEEEPERKKLKRELRAEALARLEDAARTQRDFENVIAWWDKLDANRERRERYHELSRSGDDVPLDYGASANDLSCGSCTRIKRSWRTHSIWSAALSASVTPLLCHSRNDDFHTLVAGVLKERRSGCGGREGQPRVRRESMGELRPWVRKTAGK